MLLVHYKSIFGCYLVLKSIISSKNYPKNKTFGIFGKQENYNFSICMKDYFEFEVVSNILIKPKILVLIFAGNMTKFTFQV